jgi:hypothetical protein
MILIEPHRLRANSALQETKMQIQDAQNPAASCICIFVSCSVGRTSAANEVDAAFAALRLCVETAKEIDEGPPYP